MLLCTFQWDQWMFHLNSIIRSFSSTENSIDMIVASLKIVFRNEWSSPFLSSNYAAFLPWSADKIHRGLDMLMRTSKPAAPNKTVESTISRSSLAIHRSFKHHHYPWQQKESETNLLEYEWAHRIGWSLFSYRKITQWPLSPIKCPFHSLFLRRLEQNWDDNCRYLITGF